MKYVNKWPGGRVKYMELVVLVVLVRELKEIVLERCCQEHGVEFFL